MREEKKKYTVHITRTGRGKNVIKIYKQDGAAIRPVGINASVILKKAEKKAKRKAMRGKHETLRLDENNAIEREIINTRKRKLLSVMRALG